MALPQGRPPGAPLLIPGQGPGAFEQLPSIRPLMDGEDFSELLNIFVKSAHTRFAGMTERDAMPAALGYLRSVIGAYGWRGAWVRRDGALVPIAYSSAPLLPLDAFCKDGAMHVGAPEVIASMRKPASRAPVSLETRRFEYLAALLSDHGATLAFTPMEDGPGYSATVRFPDGGTAHTDGSQGDLLAAVIEAVECHVGVDDEPETEFERAAVNVARDDVERGDVVSLDDAKVSLAGGE